MSAITPETRPGSPSPRVRPPAAAFPDLLWPLSVEQYHAMIDADILTEDDPVELLGGYLVPKMPKKPPHRLATGLLREALERILPAGWYVDSQEPVTTGDSEPEPDVMVVKGSRRQYADRHPGSSDLGLVVEVSDATLERDRTLKMRLYGAAGIPLYWVVNLPERQIEVFTLPGKDGGVGYGEHHILRPGDEVILLLDGQEAGRIAVRDLLP